MAIPRIFVSHSHKDDAFTQRLVSDLRLAGAQVWVDISDIMANDFMDRINQALDSCDWVVCVLSPDSLASRAVTMEINAALNLLRQGRLKGVIPFVGVHVEEKMIPPLWATLHRYNAAQDYPFALRGLLGALGLPTPAAYAATGYAQPAQPQPENASYRAVPGQAATAASWRAPAPPASAVRATWLMDKRVVGVLYAVALLLCIPYGATTGSSSASSALVPAWASVLLYAGALVLFAGLVLALYQAAKLRSWGWFIVFLLLGWTFFPGLFYFRLGPAVLRARDLPRPL